MHVDYQRGAALDEAEEKREFTGQQRENAADSGEALPDGSFPIKNKADLKNAIKAFGRASDEKKSQVKAHIRKRAKALGAEDELPDSWGEKSIVEWAWLELKRASADPNAVKLRQYWARGKGRAKWNPGTPGDFDRLVRQLRKYVKNPKILKGLAANIHKEATGRWPGVNAHKEVFDQVDTEHKQEAEAGVLAELAAARAELAALLGEEAPAAPEVKGEDLSEEELFEQALADDVQWVLEPDGELIDEEESENGGDFEEEEESEPADEDGTEDMDELFGLLTGRTG